MTEGEIVVEDETEQETEPARHAPLPSDPTPADIERHRTDHWPFRSWCRWCIMGRGIGWPHKASSGSKVPRVGIDYFFITVGGVKKREELDIAMDEEGEKLIAEGRRNGKMVKCLLVRCWETRNVFAHVIPVKGDDEEHYAAKMATTDMEWLGHTKLIIKADNEHAVKSLSKRISKLLGDKVQNVQDESPPAYDSQANGGTEIGVKVVRGMFRTLKLCLESRIKKHIPVNHPLVDWLLEHCCMILNTRVRGNDGQTAWSRVKGRAFNQRILCYAEAVLYKLPTKGPKSAPDGNMGARWLDGTFVGFSRASNSYMVLTPENKLVMARCIYRRPEANRWNAERLAQVKVTPWSVRERAPIEVRLQDATEVEAPRPAANPVPVPKAFRITYNDLQKYGYTEGCQQCEYNEKYGRSKGGLQHGEPCRQRILDELTKTPEGQARLDSYEEKVDRAIADRIEAEDKAAASAGGAAARPPADAQDDSPPRPLEGAPTDPETDRAARDREYFQGEPNRHN